jgi:hypothetical protein
MTRLIVSAALAGIVVFGCRRPEPGVSAEQFVAVVVALRQAAEEVDSSEFAARRDSILRGAGVTEAELRAFVREGSREPRRLADAWDSAATRLRALAAGDTAAPADTPGVKTQPAGRRGRAQLRPSSGKGE